MRQGRLIQPVATWLLCGTLDIGYAMAWSKLSGNTVVRMLQGVAKGVFGDGAVDWGIGGALLGLVTHYAIMGAMVAAFVVLTQRWRGLTAWPWWLSGAAYGLILYLIMNALVLPLRFGAPFPPSDLMTGAVALFPHIFLIGWPLAWMFARKEKR